MQADTSRDFCELCGESRRTPAPDEPEVPESIPTQTQYRRLREFHGCQHVWWTPQQRQRPPTGFRVLIIDPIQYVLLKLVPAFETAGYLVDTYRCVPTLREGFSLADLRLAKGVIERSPARVVITFSPQISGIAMDLPDHPTVIAVAHTSPADQFDPAPGYLFSTDLFGQQELNQLIELVDQLAGVQLVLPL